ncbi:MAG: arginase [Ottowia sp.]|nr:arginase [Ottowia sp.]
MIKNKPLNLIGAALGCGAQVEGTRDAPSVLMRMGLEQDLCAAGFVARWQGLVDDLPHNALDIEKKQRLMLAYDDLAVQVRTACINGTPIVFGGDHSCAIGTWSGVVGSLRDDQSLGMIWIDAHMDAHTQATSLSGAIHGMPVAILLGFGDARFTHLMQTKPKLDPRNLCLVGVRSFEEGEAKLLQQLGVRIFYMPEIQARGLTAVMEEARQIVTERTSCWGMSIDLDALDPLDAPGVGSPEPNGISAQALLDVLKQFSPDTAPIALEIAELNPHVDQQEQTTQLVSQLVQSVMKKYQ